jgi:proline-specific peptidase
MAEMRVYCVAAAGEARAVRAIQTPNSLNIAYLILSRSDHFSHNAQSNLIHSTAAAMSLDATSSSTINFTYQGETYKTWYTVVGDLKSGRRPLVVLHGGPGAPSAYMHPHVELAKLYGMPVIMYDQIGCGKSTHLKDKPKEFFTVTFFMDELENVLSHLGIAESFDLLGHSWGGMLAADWASSRHPTGLNRLILTDSLASMELWEVSGNKLLSRFPKEFQDMLHKHEREGTTDDPEYQEGMSKFNHKHICTIDPWPKEFEETLAAMGEDSTVCSTM